MLTKWLAILLVGWVLRHGYFASQLGTPDFTKDMARARDGNEVEFVRRFDMALQTLGTGCKTSKCINTLHATHPHVPLLV